MVTTNLHDNRPVPVCHITGELLAVHNDWNEPVDSWMFFVGDKMMEGHLHADGTRHEFCVD